MFCRDCGSSVSADSKFCKECGSKLGTSVRTTVLTADDLEPVVGELNQERLTKLLDMAFWHNDVGNLDSAILACEAALTINPSSTTAHSLLASLYEKKGNDERALEHLEAVLTLNPDSTADMAKMDQLKRGVHVKAIQPPRAYRWVPPALSGITLAGLRARAGTLPGMTMPNARLAPMLYSALAVAVVLGIGLAAVHPASRTVASTNRPSTTAPTRSVATVNTSAANIEPSPAPAYPTAPVESGPPVKVASTGHSKKIDEGDLLTTPDPFAETLVSEAGTRPLFPTASSAPLSNSGLRPLPNLKAVPIDPNSLPPAPVNVGTPLVTADNIPRHTVVVTQLGGQQQAENQQQVGNQQQTQPDPTPSPSAAPEADPAMNGEPAVIHVTVHNTPSASDSNGTTGLNRGDQSSGTPSIRGDEAQAYQQYALSLQEQGDYRGAKAAYERAIQTYKARIRSGHDTDDVKRGIKACKTGLEICQQSIQ